MENINKEIKKPIKNYIVAILLIAIAISSCIYFIKSYEIHKENDLSIAILGDYLNEIKINELSDYLVENPNIFIYTCFSDDEECRKLELNLRKTISENSLRDHILYLNLKTIKDDATNYEEKIKEYIIDFDIKKIPALLIYESGKLNEMKHIDNSKDILTILDDYEVDYIND